MIRFVHGDMFSSSDAIRVNPVNCVGVMGAGVAAAFKARYPEMFDEYRRRCRAGDIQPGHLHVWNSTSGTSIINFPTKRHWRDKSRYEDIEAGLTALRGFLQDKGAVTVGMPALGCGHGGLEWTQVSQMIERNFSGISAQVTVFLPFGSRAIERGSSADRVGVTSALNGEPKNGSIVSRSSAPIDQKRLTPAQSLVADILRGRAAGGGFSR